MQEPSKLASQMRKGFLEFCVLGILEKQEVYAGDMLTQLSDANLVVVEGTIYPLLSRLCRDGYLTYRWEESKSGPPRKYYALLGSGHELLAQYKRAWAELKKSLNLIIKP